jgi:hypothetical protein
MTGNAGALLAERLLYQVAGADTTTGHACDYGDAHADDQRTLRDRPKTPTQVAAGDAPLPSRDAWALVHERDRQERLVDLAIEP